MEGKKDPKRTLKVAPNEEHSGNAKKELGSDIAKKKRMSSRTSSAKGFSTPRLKDKKPSTSIVFRMDSVPLETRIYAKPSCFKKTWRVLKDVIEPKNVTREVSFIYHLQGFAIYILHFILVLWVVFGTLDLQYNYSSIILSDSITKSYFESDFIPKSLNFDEIRAPRHIWEFIRGVILKIIYPTETTNSTDWQNNIMMGVARIRQVRVKKDTCEPVPFFSWLYKHCYGYFGEDEDEEPFGPNTSLPWRYSHEPEEEVRDGSFNQYSGNGFAMNFSKDFELTVFQLRELEDNQWIRQGTRAVFLDFSTYSPNANVIHIVNLVFEMMPWGGVYPTSNIYALKLRASFKTTRQFIILGLNIVLLAYTVGLNCAIFLRLKRKGVKKFLNARNVNEIAIISFTYVTLSYNLKIFMMYQQRLPRLAEMINTSQYPNFGVFTRNYELYFRLAAVLLLCMILKISMYACYFIHFATHMVCAYKRIKGKLICFTVYNIFILIGFSLLLPAAFGQMYVSGMKTPIHSLITLLLYHAKSLSEAQSTLRTVPGPGYYLAHVSLSAAFIYIKCISLPTYVALIVHGWRKAARDCTAKDRLKISALEYLWTRAVLILQAVKLHTLADKLQERYIIRMNEDDFYPITEMLRRHGWKPLEIRLLLEKHGIRKGDDLTVDEIFELYQDFWVRNSLFFEVAEHEELMRDTEYIQRNMKYCESTIADLKSKIERLADMVLEQRTNDLSPPHQSNAKSSRKSIVSRMFRP